MALNFFKSLIPRVKAEEEDLVDPQAELRVRGKLKIIKKRSRNKKNFFFRKNVQRIIILKFFLQNFKNVRLVSDHAPKQLKHA